MTTMHKCRLGLNLAVQRPCVYPSMTKTCARWLSLYESQSFNMLQQAGVRVPPTKVVSTASQAEAAAKEYGFDCSIKAQTLDKQSYSQAQLVSRPGQAADLATKMLSQPVPRSNSTVTQVVVAQRIDHIGLWYLAMTIDRENYCPAIRVSKTRGRDNVLCFPFCFSQGITDQVVDQVSQSLHLSPELETSMRSLLQGLYQVFRAKEATHVEIDSLALGPDASLTCLDASLAFDNAAAHRQPVLFAQRDRQHEVPAEVEAEKHGLVYVAMDGGSVGTVVNGAGLAMATADAIALHGGASANFLDAGGKATRETMQQAFSIVARDPRVASILVNIYGGITRCDMIAQSIIGAKQQLAIDLPMVVRLQGTNSVQALEMLKSVPLGLHVESDFGRAAQLAVQLADERRLLKK
ncbi:hypothetical protein CDD82_3404 [Ophiocordyceps australis]|uniref:ATP-citrate lyase/succinyl-CoA ligase domain-containing protein n=1 Tax=Ophiocordyceps australis TaxID=1399860 RepID=A0A2C5ZD60_9HYPO|nr:hypothetical protein CDD82_3404 [Ophiocordyceps australis]